RIDVVNEGDAKLSCERDTLVTRCNVTGTLSLGYKSRCVDTTLNGNITIGRYATINSNSQISGNITIGHGVHVGENVTISGDITIGHGAVIEDGSTLTKDIAPYTTYYKGGRTEARYDAPVIDYLLSVKWWE